MNPKNLESPRQTKFISTRSTIHIFDSERNPCSRAPGSARDKLLPGYWTQDGAAHKAQFISYAVSIGRDAYGTSQFASEMLTGWHLKVCNVWESHRRTPTTSFLSMQSMLLLPKYPNIQCIRNGIRGRNEQSRTKNTNAMAAANKWQHNVFNSNGFICVSASALVTIRLHWTRILKIYSL